MKPLKSANRAIEKVERCLVIISLSLMIVLTFLHILLRSLYSYGHIQWANTFLGRVDWTEPFVRLLVLWVTFLGASLITGENRHIKIDILRSLISPAWIPVREMVLSMGCFFICLLMLKASIEYIHMEMEFGSILFLGIPSWIFQLILPAGFLIMTFRFLTAAIEPFWELVRKKEP